MENLIRNLYAKYAPDKDVEEQIKYVQQKYGSNVGLFVNEFYKKYAPGKLNQDTISHINKKYIQQEQQPLDVNVNAVDVDEPAWRRELRESSNNISSALSNFFPDLEVAYQSVIASTADAIKPIFGDTKVDGQTLDDLILEKYERIAELQKERKDTGEGIVKGVKEGDVSDIVGGVTNAISGVATTLLPAMVTRGQSIMPQIMAPMITDYNQEKAKNLYGDNPDAIKKLIENDEAEILMPGAIGFVAGSMERFGIKGIQKYINQNLTVGRGAMTLLMASTREGTTELGQFAAETTNRKLAQGADIAEAAWEGFASIASEEGAEAFAQGLVGGGVVSATGQRINRALRNDTDGQKFFARSIRELADRNMKRSITKKGSAEQQALDVEIKAIEDNLRTYLLDNKKIGELLNNEQKTELQNLIIEKDKIRSTLKGLKSDFDKGNITQQSYGGRVRAVTKRYSEINNRISEIKNTVDLAQYETQKRAVEEGARVAGETVKEVTKDQKLRLMEERGIIDQIMKEDGVERSEAINIAQGEIAGLYNPKEKTLYLDKETALEVGEINVAGHELLHPVFNKLIGDDAAQGKIVEDFKKQLTKDELDIMEREMIRRKYSKESGRYNREYINVFSDSITKNIIGFNESIARKIGDVIIGVLKNVGFKNISFDSGRGVYNFLKAYHRGLDSGKFDKNVLTILAKTKKIKSKIESDSLSRSASDQVQQIYESKGAQGAFDIINLFKPITNKIVEKRRGAPNFDKTLLTEEIETGERGIIDLINEYDPGSGVPLAAYINKFLPARAIEASRRVLGEEFTTDIDEARGVAAEETTAPEVSSKPKARKINPIDFVSDPNLKQKYIDDVVNKLKDLDPATLTFKNLKDLSAENTAKIFNVPTKKVVDPTANLTKQEKENALKFIRANALDLISLLPKGAVTESASEKLLGTSTGVPKSLLNKFYTKQDRITTGAGLSPFTKNRDITRKVFLETFGIIDGQKSTDFGPRTPEAQAVKAMMSLYGKLATNSIVRDQLRKQGELQSVIQDIAAGKSSAQFSRAVRRQFDLKLKGRLKVDTLLTDNGLDKSLNLKKLVLTPEGREEIINAFENNVFKLLPRAAWQQLDSFTSSNANYGVSMSPKIRSGPNKGKPNPRYDQSKADAFNELKKGIKQRINNAPDASFAPNILDSKGKPIDLKISSYKTIFTGTPAQIRTKAKKFNSQVEAIHNTLWNNIYNSIRNDNTGKVAPAIATYLKLTSNDKSSYHRRGAVIFGLSPKIKGAKYEFEHAMPATAAYLYLLDAAINKRSFATSYKLVMDNYKLIALDDADNKKLNDAGLSKTMPDNWDILDNKWWQRYFNEVVAQVDGGIDPNTIIDLDGNTLASVFNIYKDGSSILSEQELKIIKSAEKANEGMFDILIKGQTLNKQIKDLKTIDKAINFSRAPRPEKGISIFDFDQTLANTKEKVIVNMPDGTSSKIGAAEFAKTAEQLEQDGAEFDFSEFDKVKGATKGPFFELAQKIKGKFGNKDIFILTARPQSAAPAIQKFLKGLGLDIRIENITGLEDGSPQAKANFVAKKVTEGYNNFFFGDDAYKNVKAVQDVLNVVDIKSDVQQAKAKFVDSLDKTFNKIISENKGIDPDARFSEAAAKVRGAKSDKFWSRLFVPPSAEDFKGLLYMLVGKGRKGEQQMMFLEDALIKPFARAFRDINAARQKVSNQYDQLKKDLPNVKRNLLQATDYNNFTFDQAIRVYLMNKNDIDIPGIAKRDTEALVKIVEANSELTQYADRLSQIIGSTEGYIVPSDVSWLSSTIEQDLKDLNNKVNRSEYLSEWINNKNEIFNEDNLNKLEALYGKSYREALEDILYRMEIGSNRPAGQNKLVNDFTTWVNNAVGNIMFLNVRTSVLQTISFANFVNWSDNNPIRYMQAVANFPQFASDFAMIWNSDFLKQRRKGLQTDVSASEIVNQAANSKNKVSAILSYILGKGYLPTQMGDSFAICMGGAGFYRNRVKSYVKQGLDKTEAEARAFADMQETSEDAQQSARPDKISQQQAGPLGRFILAFQNTPMQYTRMIKKSGLDLLNRRRVRGLSQTQSDMTHISKILYYGAMQNFIFSALQNALFALAFSDVEEEEEKQKYSRIANNMADTILRGTGVYGAAASTLKNIALQFIRQEKKGSRADHAYTIIEGVNLSPPIGSKVRKLYSATQAVKFNRDEIAEMGFDIDNPAYDAVANTVSAVTNVPLDRAIRITDNARAALDKNNEAWQRIALALGWNTWDLGIQPNKESTGKKRKNKERKIILF